MGRRLRRRARLRAGGPAGDGSRALSEETDAGRGGRRSTRRGPPAPRRRPTPDDLEAARDRLVPDVLPAPGDPPLDVLFCGINPGLYTAATGHHFARPGNRFWPALHAGGFTPTRLVPAQQDTLPALGLGITNVAPRATARADELATAELVDGGVGLRALVERTAPRWLAVLGIGAYRVAFAAPKAVVGPQEAALGPTGVWVLPNPSGLNAHYGPADLAAAFARLRERAWGAGGPGKGQP